ncbi:MAG: helix-turn-helix transcriptional regulator [Rhizobiales bacterium]|nr:helix-turn-helix transcriptional regulator [Hyphomicrobiales bacterium]
MITAFGRLCRKHRIDRGLYLADQAESTSISVSYVSAIETGNRPIPEDYAFKVAKWLGLNTEQTDELTASVAQVGNVVKFRPRNAEAASLAFTIAKNLNELSTKEIMLIKAALERGGQDYE